MYDGEDSDGTDDEDSELADAVEIEEEDHGNGDGEPIIREVIPAGARRPAPSEGGAS